MLAATGVDLGRRAAVHALNRLGYGPRPGDVDRVLAQGLEDWILEQLDPGPDTELANRLRGLTALNYTLAQAVALYRADDRNSAQIIEQVNARKVIGAVHARNQLEEVLTDFWFNHFNIFIGDGFDRVFTPFYEKDAIRAHVFGRFRDMLGATAEHPGMLFYLDNYLSRVSRTDPRTGALLQGLNENYGRELMELHTVGVDAGYTQDDVFASARCFTGWTIDLRGDGGFVFQANNHDQNAKTVFGLSVPAGGGIEDGRRLLDYLAEHPLTARRVSKRLCQRFVSDTPPEALVARVADVFSATDGDLKAVMRAVIGSAEFWASAFDGSEKAKTPVELVFSALRAVDAEISNPRAVQTTLQAMGQQLYACIPPTGYSNLGSDWINPSTHLAAMNFGLDLASGAVAGVGADPRETARGADFTSARSIANAVNAEIFGGGLSGRTLDAAASVASAGTPSVLARVVGLLLASPEFQRR